MLFPAASGGHSNYRRMTIYNAAAWSGGVAQQALVNSMMPAAAAATWGYYTASLGH